MSKKNEIALTARGRQTGVWTSAVAGSFRSADGASNAERRTEA